MKLSVQIEGASGLTWSNWRELTSKIEQMGFAGIFCCDHFTGTMPPVVDSLEVFTALTELAGRSQGIHFGTLVAPFSFRDPVMLARQAMAIDDLSSGRMILGVGAGWNEREHTMYGYPLGDVKTRLDRFEEGLEVISRLIRGKGPANYQGKFYSLKEAEMLPRPRRSTPILVGGSGPKRTLPLVARFADIWNFVGGTVEIFKERSKRLDELLHHEDRKPEEVKRTVMKAVLCWQDQNQLEQLIEPIRQTFPNFSQTPSNEIAAWFSGQIGTITGNPAEVIDRLQEYSEAGVDELMVQWFQMGDSEGLQVIAENVLPHFA